MKHSEAHIFARELRNKITKYALKCERIEVVKLCDHYRVEIRPAKGKSSISNIDEIYNAVKWFGCSIYIDADKNVPCISVF